MVDFPCLPVISNSMNARRPLSFHAVSFGQDTASSSLRRMADIALDVQQNNEPQDPLLPATTSVPSSYTEALDTVRGQCLLHPIRLMRIFIRCTWQRRSQGLLKH